MGLGVCVKCSLRVCVHTCVLLVLRIQINLTDKAVVGSLLRFSKISMNSAHGILNRFFALVVY